MAAAAPAVPAAAFPLSAPSVWRTLAALLALAIVLRATDAGLVLRRAWRLDAFVARLDALLARGEPRTWEWHAARALEAELPWVALAVRRAGVGPAVLAAAQDVSGGATDAGRRSVWALAAIEAGAVSEAARALARRASGAYRTRAREVLHPLGWAETVVLLPAWLRWPGAARPEALDGGERLCVIVYWAWMLVTIARG